MVVGPAAQRARSHDLFQQRARHDVEVVRVVAVRDARLFEVLVDRAAEHDGQHLHPATDGQDREPGRGGGPRHRHVGSVLLGRRVGLARVDVRHPERPQVEVVATLQQHGVSERHQRLGPLLRVRPGEHRLAAGAHHRVDDGASGVDARPVGAADAVGPARDDEDDRARHTPTL